MKEGVVTIDGSRDQECGAAILHQGYHRLILCRRRFRYDLSPEESHPTTCKIGRVPRFGT